VRRRKDLGLYKLIEKAGKTYYEYQGDAYVPPVPLEWLPRVKAMLIFGCLVQAVLVFLMGRLNFPSFRRFYVVIPFLLVMFGTGKSLLSSFSLFTWKTRMTLRQHHLSWSSLTIGSLISLVSSVLLLLAVLVYLVLQGGQLHEELLLLILCAAQILLALTAFMFMKGKTCVIKPFQQTLPDA
jgi:hypothetical protein